MNTEPTRASRRGVPGGAESTRNELLALACEMVCDDGFPAGINIKLAEVVKRAGRSLGSGYQIWVNQQAFQEDVAATLAVLNEFVDPEMVLPMVTASLERGDSLDRLIEAAGPEFFRLYVTAKSSYTALHFWTVAPENLGDLHGVISANYVLHEQTWGELFDWILAESGRQWATSEAKRGFTLSAISLVQGLALPHRFADSLLREADIERAIVDGLKAFLAHYTRPRGAVD